MFDEGFSGLLLASASPRRRALLEQLGYRPSCRAMDIDERRVGAETPSVLVQRLARSKGAMAIDTADLPSGAVVIAADTVIDLDGRVLGKPTDEAHFLGMMQALSGRSHQVLTAVAVLSPPTEPATALVSTKVTMSPISAEQARRYWHTGEPRGKAGGYAIQGLGARFVAHLDGSYSNVVGLPLYETAGLLDAAGLFPAAPRPMLAREASDE